MHTRNIIITEVFNIVSASYREVWTIAPLIVVVVLKLTRITKSVVKGQAPVTLELRNTPGKNTNKSTVVHAYITADAIHMSTRNI